MNFSIQNYTSDQHKQWDNLIDNSFNGTFMHRRSFLELTPGDTDCSKLIFKDDKLVACFPAKIIDNIVISHPNATFGGLIFTDQIRGNDLLNVFQLLKQEYKLPIIYKAVPKEFHRHAISDDIWALNILGAKQIGCELSSIINPLMTNYCYWPNKQKELDNINSNISLSALNFQNLGDLNEFYYIILKNLQKYNSKPVHSVEDFQNIFNSFPVYIKGLLARHSSGKLLGGLIIFRLNKCYHVQYSVATSKGRALNVLTLLHHYMIENLPSDIHYYSLGKVTENNGKILNNGLYYYKNGFGGGSITYDTYKY